MEERRVSGAESSAELVAPDLKVGNEVGTGKSVKENKIGDEIAAVSGEESLSSSAEGVAPNLNDGNEAEIDKSEKGNKIKDEIAAVSAVKSSESSAEAVAPHLNDGNEAATGKSVEGNKITDEKAAVQLQRLFRGHRTRRNIADAAVMAHKFGWWNVVDGAMLQHQSSEFFAYNATQSASQRWMRLKKKAAKVGKGLSKDEKARKLAIQHWLEAIDPKHRYGHNLQFYYDEWTKSETQEPFFYWLDVGEGKDLELEKCRKSKLQRELITYLGPKERKWYEVVVDNGKLVNRVSQKPINTPKGEKWIFVLSTAGKLYVGKKERGKLQHSSFLAGGATIAAGRLLVNDGIIELMEAHSGHYRPTPENFTRLVKIFSISGVDLTMAKVQFVSDDMLSHSHSKKGDVEESPTSGKRAVGGESFVMEGDQLVSNVDEVVRSEGKDLSSQIEKIVEFDQYERTGSDVLEGLKGVRVEIIRPLAEPLPTANKEESTDTPDSACDEFSKRFFKTSAKDLAPQNKLFLPASRTFKNLNFQSSAPIVHEQGGTESQEMLATTKALLIRRLSMNMHVETPSRG